MNQGNFESGGRVGRGKGESTSQEGVVIKRYIDLRAKVHNVFPTDEERKDFSQELIDLVKLLNPEFNVLMHHPRFLRES